ncbi:intraflagellar transport protein 74 homolog [Ixodes scapularis]|uniref:intraflagellar transport protein 74 homolog n=1 Tax=Ixodes scapularis TaxID=6945 RepID=UPI001A9FAAC2|nr:intraflagellar transport protein 74 homolog [Ixodes scapularis]
MDSRPATSNRPPSPGMRSFTAATQRSGFPSSRLGGRPDTRAGAVPGTGVQISIPDRPITQHGLVAPKTTVSRSSQRQVQDKTYFIALLRTKMTELTNEIGRLQRENDALAQEQSGYATYEKKAEVLAAELKQLQGQMADHNLLLDKLNTDADMEDVREEYNELKGQNDQEARSVELLFEQRQDRERQLRQLEEEIEEERNMADNLIAAMKPELRQRYAEQKDANQLLLIQLDKLQQKLNTLQSQRNSLEEDISLSQIKQEAVKLYERLRELGEKKAVLQEEQRLRGTPAQERERLLVQVKEDNAELAGIERQTSEARERLTAVQEELSQLDQELEDQHGERRAKYRELKKREETMDAFLETFADTRQAEVDRQEKLQGDIVEHLEIVSRNLPHFSNLPSQDEMALLRDDLAFKEGEMEKSKMTLSTLGQEQKKLAVDLQKIEQLESKVQLELDSLRLKMKKMEDEMVVFSDLDQLKNSAEHRKQQLLAEKEALQASKEPSRKAVEELQARYDDARAKLNENEVYTRVANLERRWQHQEQNNFAAREFIDTKLAEHNYQLVKKDVQALLDVYNSFLQESLVKAPQSYG